MVELELHLLFYQTFFHALQGRDLSTPRTKEGAQSISDVAMCFAQLSFGASSVLTAGRTRGLYETDTALVMGQAGSTIRMNALKVYHALYHYWILLHLAITN